MRLRRTLPPGVVALLIFAVLSAEAVLGQAVTTSTLTGRVSSPAGHPLQSVRIVAIHLSTGTEESVLTGVDGRYTLPGLRPGGPYRVEARGLGYRTEAFDPLYLALGRTERIDFIVARPVVTLEEIEVEGERSDRIFSRARTGPSTVISAYDLANSPAISRALPEFVRLTPQLATTPNGLVAAGRSHRYNRLQIDGAAHDDLFGVSPTGAPGAEAGAAPITLEALQEVQVQISPYDVRQGGFTGAGMNAVTRGGTNELGMTAAYFKRSAGLTGGYRRPDGEPSDPVGSLDQTELAFSVGGPIRRDRAHFFVAGERARSTTPHPAIFARTAGTSGGSIPMDQIAEIEDLVRARYDFDPGTAGSFPHRTDANSLFARVDVRLTPEHRLVVRHNRVDAIRDRSSEDPGAAFEWSTSGYRAHVDSRSTVAQVNSNLGQGLFNELRIGLSSLRDARETSPAFPRIRIDLDGPNRALLGPDPHSDGRVLDQKLVELTNELEIVRGVHHFSFGTSGEFFRFSDPFVPNPHGSWRFDSLEDFRAETPSLFEHAYLRADGRDEIELPVRRWTLYAQDRWEVTPAVTTTFGMRLQLTQLPRTPRSNPLLTEVDAGPRTDEVPSSALQLNPRIGVHWDLPSDRRTQLRGGLGLFSGRTPFVWVANAYANTGVDRVRLRCRGDQVPAFTADPGLQPTGCSEEAGGRAPNEIDTIDPDYRFPQVLRMSAAVDRALGFEGLIGTLEGLYTKTLQDIRFRNLLVVPDPDTPEREGRESFQVRSIEPNDGDAAIESIIDLSNTSEGSAWNLTAQLRRPMQDGWELSAAYSLSDARDLHTGAFGDAGENWRATPTAGDPNQLPTARSRHLVRHRVVAASTVELDLLTDAPTVVSLIYVGESGRPFSYVYEGDVNGDGARANDLVRVPEGAGDIRFLDSETISAAESRENLERFIEGQACLRGARGEILARGACSEPAHHRFDLRVSQRFELFESQRAEVTIDVANLANLVNRGWGRRDYVPSEAVPLLEVADPDDVVDGRVLMRPFAPRGSVFTASDLESRYRIRIGIRYSY